jgi:phospholipase D1/2
MDSIKQPVSLLPFAALYSKVCVPVDRINLAYRKASQEHLGILAPQHCEPETKDKITSWMTPVPNPHKDITTSEDDAVVADPLSDEFQERWNNAAHRNTQIFAELFKCVPSNNVRNWKQYENYVPKVKAGHLANADLTLQQIKDKLSKIEGHVVEGAVDFLIEETEMTTGLKWSAYDPTLPIYI